MPTVPAGAKKPQDHKPKATDKMEFKFEGETYVVDPDAFDDIEFLELLQDDKYLPAFRQLLGLQDWDRFKNSIRDPKTGRVPASKAEEFFTGLQETVENANLS